MKINKINVDKTKLVIDAKPGDIAYFDDDYWLLGIWNESAGSDNKYYFVSLTQPNMAWIKSCNLTDYLEQQKAIIFDGSESSLNLIIRKPVNQNVPDDKDEQASGISY